MLIEPGILVTAYDEFGHHPHVLIGILRLLTLRQRKQKELCRPDQAGVVAEKDRYFILRDQLDFQVGERDQDLDMHPHHRG
jgi:hypothetical protein